MPEGREIFAIISRISNVANKQKHAFKVILAPGRIEMRYHRGSIDVITIML
jgi:hypothetical protein